MWKQAKDGTSLGTLGSEQGIIILDDEHSDGARITLERGGHVAPFAITCGVYGLMVHTCFFGVEDNACRTYAQMKDALATLLARLPANPDDALVADLCEDFIDRFQW